MSNIKSNIWKIYLIKGLRWFILIMPIVVLFYQENGLSMKEIFIIQSVYALSIVLFEIPLGYFSDVVGRKKSIILGTIFAFLGVLAYCFSFSFWHFILAEILLGIGESFISGTDSAILYDTLLQMKEEKRYKKVEGKMLAITNFSEAGASIIGSLLAIISLRFPLYIEAGFVFLTIPIALTLIEPQRHEYNHETFPSVFKIVSYVLHHNKEIKWLILYSNFIGGGVLTAVWFVQPFLKIVGIPLYLFGIIWAFLNIMIGIFSLNADRFEKLLGRKKALASLLLILALGYVLTALFQNYFGLLFLLSFYFVRGMHQPIVKDYLNQLISSDIRATVLSIRFMMSRLVFAILSPFLGWINDVYSLQIALLSAGVIFFALGTFSFLLLASNFHERH